MPPRRSARVVQTKKVVIETVEVSVIKEKKRRQGIADDSEEEEEEAPPLKTIAIEDKETPTSKTITIEDQEEEEEEEEEAPPLKTIAIEDKETPISKTITIEDKEEEEKQATHQVPIEPSEETEPSSSVEPETETPAAKEVIKGKTIDTPESEHGTASLEPQTKEGEEHNEAQKTAELEGIVAATVVGNESRRKKRKGRKQRGRRNEATTREYKVYVYRVLKQVHPELSISSKAMTVINNFITDMCEKISEEAAKLSDYSHLKTMSSREIEGAVKLVLPGELGKHAVAEGTKAVTNYMSHYKEQSKA